MSKIYLGGTRQCSTWREPLIKQLQHETHSPELTTPDPRKVEAEEELKNKCDIHFYYIDSHVVELYAFAEMISSACDKTKKTFIMINPKGFTDRMVSSLKASLELARMHGAEVWCANSFERAIRELNNLK